MKLLRNLVTLSVPVVAVLLAGGPLGCQLLGLPDVPQPPSTQLPELPSTPSVPSAEVPNVQTPSAPSMPEAPKMDVPKDEEDEVCCLRSGPVEQICGANTKRCCTIKLDRDRCEAEGGLWFHSVRGCAGAC
ncbi:hypothetical protein [Polyangium aurulentum]|uniref:hypothetical protein n=1 Tax=Polyangium aurulentum TaxID=2567896 RepID=UPI0010AE992E|nr:hypothetical protein [Polyangium aurulentum]UQA62871.1 hypothetical protein E8A73_021425 [Polyangium aurulentum]